MVLMAVSSCSIDILSPETSLAKLLVAPQRLAQYSRIVISARSPLPSPEELSTSRLAPGLST
eukprot:CAMPEP_0174980400 /NCGR_PEP_ID=MMETSP0004_2-20121128/15331_1 /TAXON_ID=420556 /ORGANISM="Ochromonas sp., Strain CCMP1393" /LENGTH=61 /DNA_ID=CAMNT_0016232065 /DNA_START=54 /DNA_END=236 /DNA_ORIENTATION=-